MSKRKKHYNHCYSCDDLERAGLGSGMAAKELSFQPLTATTTTFPILISLDDALTTNGIEFLRNGIFSGLQTTTGGIYDISYIVSSTVTTALTSANTLIFELVTSTGRVIADSTSSQSFPTGSVPGFAANTNLEIASNTRLFPGESVSIVLRSITPLIAGAGVISINTASLFITPTASIEEFGEGSHCEETKPQHKKNVCLSAYKNSYDK